LPSITVGDFRITLVRAGSYWWDGGAMFGVVPKTLWSKTQPADERNRIEAALNCYVIEDGKHTILVDTGIGVRHDEITRERIRMPDPPHLTQLMASRGIYPESVVQVINTHLHWDHCGGNTVGGYMNHPDQVRPAFPNATYVVQDGEVDWARKRHARDRVSYRPINYETLLNSSKMVTVFGSQDVAPGVRGIERRSLGSPCRPGSVRGAARADVDFGVRSVSARYL
jgi:glyoxylase-like metal-dependent hydrolase (beta-lactamase superfamily II)